MAENRVESQGAETGWARLALPRAGGAQGGAGLERTFIEEGAVFEGTLRVHHDLYLDSHFRGTIETTGTLSVGPAGSVEGQIRALATAGPC